MLAVVDDEQQLAGSQVLDHGGVDIEPVALLKSQRRGNCVTHRRAVVERREFTEPHAVAEASAQPGFRDFECQPGLAHPAHPGQRQQWSFAQRRRDPFHIRAATDEAGRPSRQRRRRRPVRRRAGRRRCWRPGVPFAVENLLIRIPQGGAGVDAQFFDEPVAHHAIGVERVGLSTAAVLGQHQLGGEAFIQRVRLERAS